MGGKRYKSKNRNKAKESSLQGNTSSQDSTEAHKSSGQEQSRAILRKDRPPKKRPDWILVVAVIGTIGTIVAVILAYQSYTLEHSQPDLGIHVWKVENNEEYWYDSICIDQENMDEQESIIELVVPLKIINHSDKDAANITVWITPETPGVQLIFPNGARRTEKYANQEWSVIDSGSLSPQTGAKYHNIKLRAPKGLHYAKLLWKIYATRMSPKNGSVSLCF